MQRDKLLAFRVSLVLVALFLSLIPQMAQANNPLRCRAMIITLKDIGEDEIRIYFLPSAPTITYCTAIAPAPTILHVNEAEIIIDEPFEGGFVSRPLPKGGLSLLPCPMLLIWTEGMVTRARFYMNFCPTPILNYP